MKFLRYLIIPALAWLLTPVSSLAQNFLTAPPLSITWVRTNPPVNGECQFTALNQFNYATGQYWGCLPLDNPSAKGFNVGGWKPIPAPEVVGYGAALPTFCTIGRIFYLTSAMAGANVYGCTALNTWTAETGAGAGGTVTSVSAGCGLTGGPVTTSGTLSETIPVAAHNGSYSILAADCGKALTSNVTGTYTLPQAGSAGFAAGWHAYVQNVGGSGNVTVSTTTSAFYGNGGSGTSGVLVPGSGVELVSDGVNWLVLAYTTGPVSVTGCSAAGAAGTVQVSDGAGGCIAAFAGPSVVPAGSTGVANTAFGANALSSNTIGVNNIAIGPNALLFNTEGSQNIALGFDAVSSNTLGAANIGIGHFALNSNDTGTDNIAIGEDALEDDIGGSHNVAIGQGAGLNNPGGSGNVFLGYNAGLNEMGDSKLYIDNTNTAAPLIQGDFSARTVFFNARAGATPHTPASSSEACTAGQTATDANFFYACVSAGSWKRAALSSF